MTTYTLFDFPLAFYPGRARLALIEKKVPFVTKVVNIVNGDSLRPEYLRVNPASTVPSLAGPDGKVLETESRKIVELVDTLGEGGPLGGDRVDRGLVAAWVDKIDKWDGNLYVAGNSPGTAKALGFITDFKIKYAEARAKQHPDLAEVYAKKVAAMKAQEAEAADAAAVEANRKLLASLLDDAEAQLASTPYLAGSDYSIADVMITPVIFRTRLTGQTKELLEPRPKVSEYWDRLKQRPSYQQCFGPALNPQTAAVYFLPALGKAVLARLTGCY